MKNPQFKVEDFRKSSTEDLKAVPIELGIYGNPQLFQDERGYLFIHTQSFGKSPGAPIRCESQQSVNAKFILCLNSVCILFRVC